MILYRFKRYESSTFCGKIDARLDMYCDLLYYSIDELFLT